MQYLLYIFFGYLLFLFVFRLVIPAVRTARQLRQGFRQMQEAVHKAQAGAAGAGPVAKPEVKPSPVERVGEYIEFEEVKPL